MEMGTVLKVIRKIFDTFSSVKEWIDTVKDESEQLGYAKSVSGRKIKIDKYANDISTLRRELIGKILSISEYELFQAYLSTLLKNPKIQLVLYHNNVCAIYLLISDYNNFLLNNRY